KAAEAAAKSEAKEDLEEQAKEFEDKAAEQQKVVKSLLEQTQQAEPEDKAKLEQEARDAARVLEDYRKKHASACRSGGGRSEGSQSRGARGTGVGEEGRQGHGQAGEAPQWRSRQRSRSSLASSRRASCGEVGGEGLGGGALRYRRQASRARGCAVRDH